MKQTTVEMIRAHLVTASIAATTLDVAVVSLLFFFRFPEAEFETASFRLLMCTLLCAAVLTTRQVARRAFRAALRQHYARFVGPDSDSVSVSAVCPSRTLVILHLHFTGVPYVPLNRTSS